MRTPIGFAHRGARALERDNTLRSFSRALGMGANALESDVWVTADGVAVLDHDGYVGSRRKKTRIREVGVAELPSHIPSLADLYAVCGTEFLLSLDIKDPDAAASAVDVAREAGGDDVVRRLWMCHPDWQIVRGWRELSPVVVLVDSTRLRKIDEGFETRVERLADVGIDAINMHHRDWERSHVEMAHNQGLYAMAWDLQRPSDLDRLLAMKIDAVFSDHVDRMTFAISRRVGGQGRSFTTADLTTDPGIEG